MTRPAQLLSMLADAAQTLAKEFLARSDAPDGLQRAARHPSR